ncbi:MAG: hypothetical protein RJA98_3534 [Pseudomonadota bacterium]
MGRADLLRVLLVLPSVGPFPLYLRKSARPITAPTTVEACESVHCRYRFGGALCRIRFAQVKGEPAAGRRRTRSKANAAQRSLAPALAEGEPPCRKPPLQIADCRARETCEPEGP